MLICFSFSPILIVSQTLFLFRRFSLIDLHFFIVFTFRSLSTSFKFTEKYFFKILSAKRISKSSPPSFEFPPVPSTLKIPSLSSKIDTSKVPPPKS